MQLSIGIQLKATALLNGTFFQDAVILLTECNAQGAVGFVTNKLFSRKLNELQAYITSAPINLYDGGPVERESLFFIHQRPDLIEDGKPLGNGLYYGGNFNQAIEASNNALLQEAQIQIFIGYCGRNAGELEAEIEEGSWIVSNTGIDAFEATQF